MAIFVSVETTIARDRTYVADYVSDPSHEPRWISGIMESMPVTPGPIRIGSLVRRRAKFMGREIEYTPEVVEMEPGERLLMKTDKPFAMTIEYRFADRDGKTLFQQRLQGGPGGLMGLLDPLMALMVRRNVGGDMERLKVLLEQQQANQ